MNLPTEAIKYFDKHLITGEREWNQRYPNSRTVDSVIIYAQGQREAWQQLHALPRFQSCPLCPHEMEEEDMLLETYPEEQDSEHEEA